MPRQITEAVRVANHQARSLTPVQSRQYLTFLADTFNSWEFAIGGRSCWNDQGPNLSPAFRSYVDSVVASF